MTAEQIREEHMKQLEKKFEELSKGVYTGIMTLKGPVKDYSDKKITLLLEILNRSDEKILDLINE
jgi:hypothetical protein